MDSGTICKSILYAVPLSTSTNLPNPATRAASKCQGTPACVLRPAGGTKGKPAKCALAPVFNTLDCEAPTTVGGAATSSPLWRTMNQTDRPRSGFSRETGAYTSKLKSRLDTDSKAASAVSVLCPVKTNSLMRVCYVASSVQSFTNTAPSTAFAQPAPKYSRHLGQRTAPCAIPLLV